MGTESGAWRGGPTDSAVARPIPAWPQVDHRALLVATGAIPVAALAVLLSTVVWMSFRQGEQVVTYNISAYLELYGDPFTYRTLWNTAVFSVVTGAVSLFFGVTSAWLVERTDLSPKELPLTLMVLGLLTPGFLSGMGWVFLFHPRIGVLNQLLRSIPGMDWATVNVATPHGMGFVQGLVLAPLAFIMVSAALRAMDPALEEAAAAHGLGFLSRMRRVTLPLILPGVLGTAIYIVTIGIAAFELPAVIGLANRVFTFSTFLYTRIFPMEGLPRYDLAGAFGMLMMLLALGLLFWYFQTLRASHRYAVVTGKAYRPRPVELGPWRFVAWGFLGSYILLGQVLPLAILIWNALMPYPQPPSLALLGHVSLNNFRGLPWHQLLLGARNTLLLGVLVPTFVLFLSLALSWVVIRSGWRYRFVFDIFAFLPHAVPHILLAVSASYAALFILKPVLPIYGTIYILMGVYVLIWLSYATRTLNSALLQLHRELDEAALVSGVPLLRVFRRVLVPLLKPTLLNAWLWIALLTCRELTIASILASVDNVTLPAAIWGIWLEGVYGKAAAAATLVTAVMIPLVAAYWFFGRRGLALRAEI